jgi:serine/threonine protein kinase
MIDHWKTHKKLFVVLELCEGSLKDRLKNLSLQEAMRVFEEIMMGMKDIHDSDIVHQDIKLDNILIKDGKVKISDFGLATKID